MDGIERLARRLIQMYEDNRNPPSTACRTGVVVEASPLKIQWGERVVLTEDKLIVPKIYREGYQIPYRWQDTKGKMIDAKTVLKVELQKGDEVIIAPDPDMQMFYVIGEVGG